MLNGAGGPKINKSMVNAFWTESKRVQKQNEKMKRLLKHYRIFGFGPESKASPNESKTVQNIPKQYMT